VTLELSIITRKIPIYFCLFYDVSFTLARHQANSEPSAAAEGRQDEGRHNVRRGVAISSSGTSNVARACVSHVRPASASAMVHGPSGPPGCFLWKGNLSCIVILHLVRVPCPMHSAVRAAASSPKNRPNRVEHFLPLQWLAVYADRNSRCCGGHHSSAACKRGQLEGHHEYEAVQSQRGPREPLSVHIHLCSGRSQHCVDHHHRFDAGGRGWEGPGHQQQLQQQCYNALSTAHA